MSFKNRRSQEKKKNRTLFGYFFVSAFLLISLSGVLKYQWDNILHVLALTSVSINSGTTSLDSYTEITSQTLGLGSDTAEYTWTVDGANFTTLNIPFNMGASQTDLSGYGNTMTVTNAAHTTVGCKVGTCYDFNGSTDYLSAPLPVSVQTSEISVEAWLNMDTLPSVAGYAYRIINGQPRGSDNDGRGIFFYVSTGNKLGFLLGTGTGSWTGVAIGQTSLTTGTWYHLVGTYDGNQIKLYINGVEELSVPYSLGILWADQPPGAWPNPAQLFIGAGRSNNPAATDDEANTGFIDGKIDDVKMYPRAISLAQIVQNYTDANSGNGGPSIIVDEETLGTETWGLSITPFTTAGVVGTPVVAGNTVSVTSPSLTANLHSGVTTLSTYSDLVSTVTNLGTPQAAYSWTVDGSNLMNINIPFNSGGTQTDYSNNAYNGTNTNGALTVGGCKVGYCAELDGADDYVLLPASARLNSDNDFTISAWVNKTTQTTVDVYSDDMIYGQSDGVAGSDDPVITFSVLNNGFLQGFIRGTTTGDYVLATGASTAVDDGDWHHVVLSWDASLKDLKVYIDNALEVTGTETGTLTGNTSSNDFVAIGGVVDDNNAGRLHPYNGKIDEFQIFQRSLSIDEITRLYTDGNAGNAGPTQIVDDETRIGEVWDVDITPFESDGTALTQVNSSNTVTIVNPGVTASLNSGTTTLSTFSDLTSTIANLGNPQAAYTWTIGGSNLLSLNIPFNPGLTQIDYSGSPLNGMNTNGPIYHSPSSGNCKVGGCMEFDGSDDFITGSTTNLPTGAGDRTISLWVKSDNFATGNRMLFGYGTAVNDGMSALAVGLGNLTDRNFGFWGYFADLNSGAGVLNDNVWNHIAATIINNTVTLYHDGVAITSQNFPGLNTSSGSSYYIGDFTTTMGNFDGLIDEVQVYNRGFSPDQITRLYNDGNAGNAGPTQIVDDETIVTEVWDVDITPFESDGTALSQVNSTNTVTITAPSVTVGLNNGVTFLDSSSSLSSQVLTLGDPAGSYTWQLNSNPYMEVNYPFNPGLTQTDYSGNGVNGTSTNGPTYQPPGHGLCKVGGCMQFDGDNDYIDTSSTTILDTAEGSISAWINPDNLTTAQQMFIARQTSAGTGNTMLILTSGGVVTFQLYDGAFRQASTTSPISAGTWYHIVATWGAAGMKVYHNGSEEGTNAFTGKSNSSAFTTVIGNWKEQVGADYGFDGYIDEVQFFDHALSSSQITQLYNNGNSGIAGPIQITSTETTLGEVWDLGVTHLDSNGAALSEVNSTNTVTIVNNTAPNIPVLVSPTNASTTNSLTPILKATFSDPDAGISGVGTVEFRVSSGSSADCLNNINIVDAGSSATTATNNEEASRTVGGALTDLTTYNWCARNFDTALYSNGGGYTTMGSFTVDTAYVPGGSSPQKQQSVNQQISPEPEPPVEDLPVEEETSNQESEQEVDDTQLNEEPELPEEEPPVELPDLPQQEQEEAPGDNQPPPPPEPPQEQESINIDQILDEMIDQETQEITEDRSGRPPNPTPSETGIETNSQSDGRSFTIEVEDQVLEDELIVTGLAQTDQGRIEFTGQTSEPNSTVTLIFNNSVTIVVTSDENGFWQTFVSAEQLGVEPGQNAAVQVDAIAAKGALRSEKVSVGFVDLHVQDTSGDIVAEFESIVEEESLLTIVHSVQKQTREIIKEQEQTIQQTLTVTAPVVVVASAPLWGYLPYAPTLIYHFLTYLLGLLGRKKQDEDHQFGTVYDAITKKSLSLVVLRIFTVGTDATSSRLVTTKVTNKAGRFDLLLEPGEYRIEAKKPQYIFPSKIETFNSTFSLNANSQPLTLHIPLDPVNTQRQFTLANIFKKFWLMFQRVGHILAVPVLCIGALASALTVAAVPESPENWLLATLYIFLFFLQLKLRPVIEKTWGVVYDLATNAVLPLTTIQLIDPEYGKVVTSRLTDYEGRFAFLPEPGKYLLKASKPGYEQADVVESPGKKFKPVSGEVAVNKEGERIQGDIAMKQI